MHLHFSASSMEKLIVLISPFHLKRTKRDRARMDNDDISSAFAILAYQTLAEWYTTKEDVQRANVYHHAVEQLIAAVHDSLGKPRNRGPASKMRECAISPTGYVG